MKTNNVNELAARSMISKRTDEELIRDWVVLDETTKAGEITVGKATVRGWLMDEIEKRWPAEFENWIENCCNDDNIENYIKVGVI